MTQKTIPEEGQDPWAWNPKKIPYPKHFAEPEISERVDWFASYMKQKLRENDYKDHPWRCHSEFVRQRIQEEMEELHAAILEGNLEEAIKEAADVANFAMMAVMQAFWEQLHDDPEDQ